VSQSPLGEQLARARKAITHLVDRTESLSKRVDEHDKAAAASDAAMRTAELARTDVDAVVADIARLNGGLTALRDRVEELETARTSKGEPPAADDAEAAATGDGDGVPNSTASANSPSATAATAALVERMEALEAAFIAAPRATKQSEATEGGPGGRGWTRQPVSNLGELRRAAAVADVDVDGSVALSTTRVVVSGFPPGMKLPQLRVRLEGAGPVVSVMIRRTSATQRRGAARSKTAPPGNSDAAAQDLQEVALVTYADADGAARAIENLNGLNIAGSRLRVVRSTPAELDAAAADVKPSED
jgi:hypothetical protein